MTQTPTLTPPGPPVPAARSVRLAIFMLAGCCVLWGASFPLVQLCTTALTAAVGPAATPDVRMELAGRLTFNGWRFAMAACAYWLLTRPRQRGYSPADVRAGLWVGLFFAGGIFLQVVGLRYTLPSVSGFLTALAVIFAPVAQALLFRRAVGGMTWLAVIIATAGVTLLAAPDSASMTHTLAIAPPLPLLGEILTILSAILFTAQILAVDRLGPSADAARMTLVMFASTGLVSILAGLMLGAAPYYRPAALLAAFGDITFLWTMGVLVLLSGVAALHLMNTWQPMVSPATATVIYCLEPVFAMLFSLALRTESLRLTTLAGGATVLVAVMLVARASRKLAPHSGIPL